MGDYEDFEMISLSLDGSPLRVRAHVEEHGLTWPHVCVGTDSKVAADYGVTSVPQFIFIGPDGRILPSGEAEGVPKCSLPRRAMKGVAHGRTGHGLA